MVKHRTYNLLSVRKEVYIYKIIKKRVALSSFNLAFSLARDQPQGRYCPKVDIVQVEGGHEHGDSVHRCDIRARIVKARSAYGIVRRCILRALCNILHICLFCLFCLHIAYCYTYCTY